MKWREIHSPALRGATNMAFDQALLEGVQAGGPPVLRLYRWAPACLSLGRNQSVDDREWLLERLASRGYDLVRRPTGGAAVLHEHEVTYALSVPLGLLGSPRETYQAINEGLVIGLRRLGVPAMTIPPRQRGAGPRRVEVPRWNDPCFQSPAPGEIIVNGLKLVGSAQRREGRTLLQHGSILLRGGQEFVAECLDREGTNGLRSTARMPAGFTTLEEVLGTVPSWDELTTAIGIGLCERFGVAFYDSEPETSEVERIEELTALYESESWTWR